jgi:hypothetical protein
MARRRWSRAAAHVEVLQQVGGDAAGVKSGGGGSSYGAAARHVSKAEVETTPLSSFPPVPALSSFPLAPPLSSFPPACRREGLATVSARARRRGAVLATVFTRGA